MKRCVLYEYKEEVEHMATRSCHVVLQVGFLIEVGRGGRAGFESGFASLDLRYLLEAVHQHGHEEMEGGSS